MKFNQAASEGGEVGGRVEGSGGEGKSVDGSLAGTDAWLYSHVEPGRGDEILP